jgi:hypothetical protein
MLRFEGLVLLAYPFDYACPAMTLSVLTCLRVGRWWCAESVPILGYHNLQDPLYISNTRDGGSLPEVFSSC